MPESRKAREEPFLDRIMAACCNALPNCGRAIHLVETACERDLTLREKVQLKYDRRLCPFCGCAAGKFASVENKLEEIRKEKASGQSPSAR